MGFNMKDLKKELFNAALITSGVAAVGFVSKKTTGDSLGTPGTIKGTLKLGLAVALGVIGVKFCQDKKWLPTDSQV